MNAPAPPRLASRLVSLLALDNETEAIEGDLLEEFSSVASRANPAAASRWYWKQSLKTSAHLAWTSLRTAPWLIAVTALVGFLILRYSQHGLNLSTRLVCAIIDHDSAFYMNHFSAWQFCLNYGISAVDAILVLIVGCLIAMVARGREIVATATFGVFQLVAAPIPVLLLFVFAGQVLFGRHWMFSDSSNIRVALAYIYQSGDIGGLILYFISPLTTVLLPIFGGMIVRKIRRSAAPHLAANGAVFT